MARYKSDHRDRTRMAIVDAAGKMLRQRGFGDTGVGEVMKAVGLTHGGFYAHFTGKAGMLEAALERAFVESPKNFAALAQLAQMTQDTGVIALHYLSDQRVENIEEGCPAAALVSEMHRQDPAIRAAFQSGAEETARALSTAPGLSAGGLPWATLAMLVGSLAMMRAMPDPEVRRAIRDQAIGAMPVLASKPR